MRAFKHLFSAFLFTIFWSTLHSQIPSNGLILALDASDSNSYSGSGNTWYDISGQNAHAEAVNLPSFGLNGAQIKNFDFDGTNDEFHSVNMAQEYRDLIVITKLETNSGLPMLFGHYDNRDDSMRFESGALRNDGDGNDWQKNQGPDVFINGQFNRAGYSVFNTWSFIRTYRSNNGGFGTSFRYELSSSFLNRRYSGKVNLILAYNRKLSNQEVTNIYNTLSGRLSGNASCIFSCPPEISQTKIAINNSTVSVTFSELAYGGSSNSTSTLEAADFSLAISGGSATLSSATPSSISINGTTIALGISLSGTPDGSELLTILPASNSSIFGASGDAVSTTQTSNTTKLIPNIVTSGLILYLDPDNPSSYPGSGSNWYDLSGNNYDFTIDPSAFRTSNGIKHMDFEGSYGQAIRIVSGSRTDVPAYANATMQVFSSIKNSTANWRTLARGAAYDHPVLIKTDNILGKYDNQGAGWISSGFNITSLPNPYTQFNFLDFKLSTSSPYYSFKFNATTTSYQITNSNATFNQGFASIGNTHGNDIDVSTAASQPWGKIGVFLYYNRKLTNSESLQNYNAFRSRYGLPTIPPIDIGLTSNTISENLAIGSVVGTLSAVDSDTSASGLTFALVNSGDARDDDNGSFSISGTTLLTSTTLDYETKNSYNIYINVSDGTANFAKAFTVSITNINEPPVDLGFESTIIENGLLMYLDATNPDSRGTNQWMDLSGNGNHANVNGATLVSDSYYSLDGNDWFNWTTDVLTTDGPYTMQGFIKTTNTNWNGSNAFYNTYRSDKGIWWHFNTNGTLGWRHYGNGGTNGNLSGFNFVQNQWQMVTLTFDGSNLKLYIDKNYKSSANAGSYYAGAQNGNSGATMGRLHSRNGDYSFHGQIRNKLIYNRALTQQEIEKNYDLLNGSFGGGSGNTTSTASFDEGSAVGTVVATLTATDTDTTNLTYSLASGNSSNDQHNSLFTVSGTQLLVASSTISYDATTSLNVNLQVSDGDTTISKAFQIAVNDLNRAPTDIILTSNTITENASPSTVIGTLSSVDLDTTDTTSFTLASSNDTRDDDNGSFTISGTSLILNSSPDYETKASYNIYINVNDGANNYAKAFTVSVTNVNEPVTDIGFAGASIVTNGLVLHLDAGNSSSYSGSGNTWNDISGNNNHGTLNGPTFVNSGLKHFVFNGTDDVASLNLSSYSNLTFEFWFYDNRTSGQRDLLTYNGNGGSFTFNQMNHFRTDGNGQHASKFPTSLVSNQWVRFVYVKNSKIFINNTKTVIESGSDRPYGQLRIGDARSDVGQHWDGKIAVVRIYNRNLTDQEIATNYEAFDAVVNNNTPIGTPTSTVSVDEEVDIGTVAGSLIATDADTTTHTFTLVSGNGDTHNGLFSISGTNLLVNGFIDYEQTPSLSMRIQATDGQSSYSRALTINVNDINEPPLIISTTLASDNSVVSVTFSEAVFDTNSGSGALEVGDFSLSINGGTATLTSSTPSSISSQGNTYGLGIPLSGNANGSEVLTVAPVVNSIYDANAAVASTTQTSNTINLYGDSDGDGVNDPVDLCPNTPNGESVDADGCAESQKDPDNDGVTGVNDNCPTAYNPSQTDTDGDGIGDACDPDDDNDGIADGSDNCPLDPNSNQVDTDSDNIGNLCDSDDDNDGYEDQRDAFPLDPSEWDDTDSDGIGNNADPNDDNDQCLDEDDAFPLDRTECLDTDGDEIGNNADPDDDNDGYEDQKDAFPLDPNEWIDTDGDGVGNNTDTDDDGDGYLDEDEIACGSDPLRTGGSGRPKDYDQDFIPDCVDPDDDNDGCLDQEDAFPLNERECKDSDGDGVGDESDFDDDNDGVWDDQDAFPLDPNETTDTDGDGIGDNVDTDKNNDGFPDDKIEVSQVLTPGQPGIEATWKIINLDRYPSANVKVYDFNGVLVYESWDYRNDWNATDMKTGDKLPTGPYFYIIDKGDGSEIITGWIYIFTDK